MNIKGIAIQMTAIGSTTNGTIVGGGMLRAIDFFNTIFVENPTVNEKNQSIAYLSVPYEYSLIFLQNQCFFIFLLIQG